MGDAFDPGAAFGGVQIGVEDAASAGELKFDSGAFAHLESGLAEAQPELVGGEADQVTALDHLRDRLGRCRSDGLWRGGAGGEEQRGGGDE